MIISIYPKLTTGEGANGHVWLTKISKKERANWVINFKWKRKDWKRRRREKNWKRANKQEGWERERETHKFDWKQNKKYGKHAREHKRPKRREKTTRRDRWNKTGAWIPHEILLNACAFFRSFYVQHTWVLAIMMRTGYLLAGCVRTCALFEKV